MMPMKQITGSE
ncbi:Protein of unknown function [Lactobacillus helveticus CIRM-BIA 101]|nr:Protein of unknown function [Lactobacillus helveticus CIRM-BIA 101]